MPPPPTNPSPFRQSALDRLSSPEQLDALVKVADAKGWIAAAAIMLIIAFGAVWSVFGSIPTEVEASGIMVSRGGHLMNVSSPSAGMVTQLRIRAGDRVSAGQVLAIVSQSEQEQRLRNAEQILRERQNTLDVRRSSLQREMAARRENAEVRRAGQRQVMAASEARLDRLKAQLTIREGLRRQNLTTEERVEQSLNDIARAREEVSESRARLGEIESILMEADMGRQKELDTLQQAVSEAQRNVGELSQRLQLSKAVTSPSAGRVTEVTTGVGSTLASGSPILSIETSGAGLKASVYIAIDSGKKVYPGMPVNVSPVTVRREEYGMLMGRVSQVSSFPSTPQGMLAVLQNQKLVEAFAGSGSPYEATIELTPARTPTGYAWTSGRGPRTDLTSGTPVRIYITVRSDPPILLIMPFLKPLFGDNR
jgi:HlyD family secretion protein